MVVQPQVPLVHVEYLRHRGRVVVLLRLAVGHFRSLRKSRRGGVGGIGQEGDERLRLRGDHARRNYVVQERLSRLRVVKLHAPGGVADAICVVGRTQCAEVALLFGRRWQIVLRDNWYPLTQTIVIKEEKRMIFKDRTAHLTAELVAVERRPRYAGRVVYKRIGVEDRVLNVFISVAMEAVCAGL